MMNKRLVTTLFGCWMACLLLGLQQQAAVAQSPGPLKEFRFRPDGDLITLPVRMGNDTLTCVLDSGATGHVYDVSLENQLGTPIGEVIANRGLTNEVRLRAFQPPEVFLEDLVIPANRPVVTFDLSPFREAAGCDMRGFLGLPVFEKWIVQLDFNTGVIRFFPPGSHSREWGNILPLTRTTKAFYVKNLRIGPITESFLFDTGANGQIGLMNHLYDRLEGGGQVSTVRNALSVSVGGTFTKREGRLHATTILGPYSHEGLLVETSPVNKLGLAYLSRFLITIDLPNSRLYLRKGRAYATRQYPDMSGAHLLMQEGKVVIDLIDDGSPAKGAGVQEWDEIVQVDGKPVGDMSLASIRTLFRSVPGRLIRLTVVRDDRQIDLSFRLKEHFDLRREGATK